jgi:hypothetical protein
MGAKRKKAQEAEALRRQLRERLVGKDLELFEEFYRVMMELLALMRVEISP